MPSMCHSGAMNGMMRAALAGTMLFTVAVPSAATAAVRPERPDLQAVMQELVDDGIPGVQLRVPDQPGDWAGSAAGAPAGGADQHGSCAGSGAVREAGLPARPRADRRFGVGSAAMTCPAPVVLELVAEGRRGLVGPVARHLPRLGLDPRITVRML